MKILVCTDGSEQSRKAAVKAADLLANREDAEVTVLHVWHIDASFVLYPEAGHIAAEILQRIEQQKQDEGNRMLSKTAAIFEGKNIKTLKMLKRGHPATTIVETASEGGFDLVVIGSRGLGGIKKMLLGSVSNAVAQEAHTSVMIVK